MAMTHAAETRKAVPTERVAAGLRSTRGDLRVGPVAQRHWKQGVTLARCGELLKALQCFERACSLAPGQSLYWLNQASVQRRLGREQDALASAQRAADLDPTCRNSAHLLAELWRLRNRPAAALAALDALQADTSADARHALLRGAALAALDRHQEAAIHFVQVLGQQPRETEAYGQMGFSLVALRQYAAAAECFRTASLLDPTLLGAAIHAAHYADWACDWPQAAADRQRMMAAMVGREKGRNEPHGFSPFCLLSMDEDGTLQRRGARIEARRMAAEMRQRTDWRPLDAGAAGYPQAAQALATGRCRVGFVSNDFRTHATSILLAQVLERLDRSRFELVLYSHGADDGSALRHRMAATADRFVDCREMSLPDQAARIRDDGITVLVDLGGYTRQSRLALFALRPAPVQATWLGYPGTLGADWIDYLIGDAVVAPMAHAADFDERLVQLPVCYQPNDARRIHPETTSGRGDHGLPEDGFVYACFNQSYKITEAVFDSWCRILQRVPASVLWLLVPEAATQATLAREAQVRGVAAGRLVFAPFLPIDEHLARLPLADVALDTFPCGAHTTGSDALWMGVPLLTRMGRSFASRVAGSLLHAVGLPELAVDDAEAYEEIAVRLAEDREALTDIRDHLWDNRLDLPLFDAGSFAVGLGDALGRMAQRWQQGLPPAHLPAA